MEIFNKAGVNAGIANWFQVFRMLPAIDANEITDKGYINQRAVLERRADLVERLYSNDPDVIRL